MIMITIIIIIIMIIIIIIKRGSVNLSQSIIADKL